MDQGPVDAVHDQRFEIRDVAVFRPRADESQIVGAVAAVDAACDGGAGSQSQTIIPAIESYRRPRAADDDTIVVNRVHERCTRCAVNGNAGAREHSIINERARSVDEIHSIGGTTDYGNGGIISDYDSVASSDRGAGELNSITGSGVYDGALIVEDDFRIVPAYHDRG